MTLSKRIPAARTPVIHIYVGLPAAGKTTAARELAAKAGGMMRRINLDDLRAMLDPARPDGRTLWSHDHEQITQDIQIAALRAVVLGGYDAVIDDTDLTRHAAERIRSAVGRIAYFVVHDLTDVPVDECIRRDAQRPVPVGADVIRLMAANYAEAAAAGWRLTEEFMNENWDAAARGAAWARAHAPETGSEDEAA